jgi:hypothetical protein
MSADVIVLPVIRIERSPVATRRDADIPACTCLVHAIAKHHTDLMAWIEAGGDARLLEFTPLDSWGPILKMGAELNSLLLQLKASEHQS